MNHSKTKGDTPAQLIEARIKEVGGWRGETLAALRALITTAAPGVIEEWKWNVPVWSLDGIICTGETYKAAVKLTFAKGADVQDPKHLFNSSLEGNARRAIDFKEGDTINEAAFKTLIRAAVAINKAGAPNALKKAPTKTAQKATSKTAKTTRRS